MMKRQTVVALLAAVLFAGGAGIAAEKKQPRGETKTVAYLGVATESVEPAVARHLKLRPGEGLEVQMVDEKSPAQGTIRVNDILKELNGQWLVNPEQLRTVVRMMKPGEEANLVVIREGESRKVSVKLGSREVSPEEEMQAQMPRGMPGHGMISPEDMMRMYRGYHGMTPRGQRPWPQEDQDDKDQDADVERDGKTGKSSDDANVSVNVSSSTTISENGQTVTLTDHNGDKRLKVTKGNKKVFEGPVSTEEQVKALAPEIRELFDKVSKQGASIKVKTQSSGKGRVDI